MSWALHIGDCLDALPIIPEGSVNCVVTSPPYWGLRDYGLAPRSWPEVTFAPVAGLPAVTTPAESVCLGMESDPWAYVAHMVHVFREVRRVLCMTGTLWLNLGNSYTSSSQSNRGRGISTPSVNGHDNRQTIRALWANPPRHPVPQGFKKKDLVCVPHMVAQALQADGWYLRADIVWHKPGVKPESVLDRTTRAHESIFLLSRSARYLYDAKAIKEPAFDKGRPNGLEGRAWSEPPGARPPKSSPNNLRRKDYRTLGRNKRSVWTINPSSYPGAHFATMPTALAEVCILAGCPKGGTVLDPFAGAGSTLYAAERLGRESIGIEANPQNEILIRARMTAGRRAAPPLHVTAKGTML